MIRVEWNPGRQELRRFGLSLALGATVAGAISLLWPGWLPPAAILWGIAAVLGVAATAVPVAIRPLHTLLWGLTYGVFWVVAAVVLAVIYFAILTPIGLALRLAGRDLVGRRIDPESDSYWSRLEQPETSDYFKQF